MIPEEKIEDWKKITGRSCGECSLCCWLLSVPQVGKSEGEYCVHCKPGQGGCTIYKWRPNICRTYACQWLINVNIPDYWNPLRSKMILDYHRHKNDGSLYLRIHCHPDYPSMWSTEPYFTDLRNMAREGLLARDLFYRTVVILKGRYQCMILPDKAVPWERGVTLRCGTDRWEHVVFDTDQEVIEFGRNLDLVAFVLDKIDFDNPELKELVKRTIEKAPRQRVA